MSCINKGFLCNPLSGKECVGCEDFISDAVLDDFEDDLPVDFSIEDSRVLLNGEVEHYV